MSDAAARIRLTIALMAASAIALLVPSLSATGADASLVMVTAVAALVAAVVAPGRHLVVPAAGPSAARSARTEQGPSFLAARVTDTARHPVRPRAPGVV